MSNSPELVNIHLEQIRRLRDNLRSEYQAEWHSSNATADGVISSIYPQYEPWLRDGIMSMDWLLREHLNGAYEHYLELDMNRAEGIPSADLNQITDWVMYLWRGERFCDGHIGMATEQGVVLAVAERVLEIFQTSPRG